ncbi:MAG: flagellar hook protein FliD [Burkholderiaceae bacterium]|nr:MAG: flagellar hook protein FliD [Burkholderiaceae bacterium]
MATIQSPGLGSGLDVNGIVTKLMSVESQPLTALQNKETSIKARLSALGSLKSSVSSFQDAAKALNNLSKFTAMKASVADATVASVSASSSAVAGTYNLEVVSLANPHRLKSTALASADTVVGTGTLTFTFGTYDSIGNTFTANPDKAGASVTIAAGQDTLAGVRDAINAANIGVRANLINDGTGVRLALTTTEGGAANSIRLTVADDDATNTNTSGLSQLAYDPTAVAGSGKNLTQTSPAPSDASVKIDGVTITSTSNTLTNPVDGLTINLLDTTDTGVTTAITVAKDPSAAQTAVDTFVKSYNALTNQLQLLMAYNKTTGTAGPLNGDATARAVQSGLRSILNQTLSGVSGNYTTLSSVGISAQKDGTLSFDTSKFQTAAAANPTALAALFANVGQVTDSRVSFSSAGSSTSTGTFAINVTTPATQGNLAGNASANLTITAGVNDSLTVSIDGTAATVTLTAGTYASATALAAEVQARLNGSTTLSSVGKAISVSQSAGVLTITSNSYGSTSSVGSASGNAASDLLGAAPTATAGVNVAGTIGGTSATGSGQFLTSSDGLSIKVAATTATALGNISYSRGYGALLSNATSDYLKTNGLFSARETGLNASISDIDKQQTALQNRLIQVEARYRAQFTALDTMISSMNQTSSFLTQQLASLSALSNSSLK